MRARLQHYAGARFLLPPRRRQVVKLLSEGNFLKNLKAQKSLFDWGFINLEISFGISDFSEE